jgi:predicted RNA binding protein YcfA (HicA-like mRNA interferase family)
MSRELIRKLEELGCVLVRHGGSHDWYTNPATKKSQPVPRHNESTKDWQSPLFGSSAVRRISRVLNYSLIFCKHSAQ